MGTVTYRNPESATIRTGGGGWFPWSALKWIAPKAVLVLLAGGGTAAGIHFHVPGWLLPAAAVLTAAGWVVLCLGLWRSSRKLAEMDRLREAEPARLRWQDGTPL